MRLVAVLPVTDSIEVMGDRVRTRQLLRIPLAASDIDRVSAALAFLDADALINCYAAFLQDWTRNLVAVRRLQHDLALRLTRRGPVLLWLRVDDRSPADPAVVVAKLDIKGGLFAVAGADTGSLVLRLALDRGVAFDIEVLVEDYHATLLALPLPRAWRRWLYGNNQDRLHRAVTHAFLRTIAARFLQDAA